MPALAALGSAVTLVSGDPGTISPSKVTRLQITLSNSNANAAITGVGFSNMLPGALPDGLKISGPSAYTCADGNGSVSTVGTLTASSGTQAISLLGATIPAHVNNTDGTCTLVIPVTAGTSTGSATSYTYTILSGAVTGNDGGAVSNSGNVSQTVNVSALSAPSVSKSFSNSTLILGGSPSTLTITINNSNGVDLPGVHISDAFPTNAGGAIIQVASTPTASSSCSGGGTALVFAPVAAATSLSATGGVVPANGSCTLKVDVVARQTNGLYDTGTLTNRIRRAIDFGNDIGIPASADATASVRSRSPLAVTKTVTPSALATGNSGSFILTLFNNGNTVLPINSFTDNPIDGIGAASNGLSVNSVSTTCGGTAIAVDPGAVGHNTGVTLTGGSILAGGSCTITISFTGTVQNPRTPISYTNSIPAGAVDVGDPAIISQSRSAAITIFDTLNVIKSASPSNPAPGNPVRYQVTVQNWSVTSISNMAITDTLTNAQTFLTGIINGNNFTPALSGTGCVGLAATGITGAPIPVFTIGTLPARSSPSNPGSCTVTFWAMTDSNAANNAVFGNQLTAGAVCYNSGATCNGGASNTVTGAVNANVLSVVKSFSPAGPLPEGAITRMTINLSNLSANNLSNVAISDTLPVTAAGAQMRVASPANAATTCAGAITAVAGSTSISLNGGNVSARATNGTGIAGSCRIEVDVTAAAGSYTNTAAVTAIETYANGSTHPLNINGSAGIVFNSSLSASKSFNPAAVTSGGRATVTVRLNNTGGMALTGVNVTDPLPSGMVLANPANAHTTCAGSTHVTAATGANSVSLGGAEIAGNGSCDLLFDVVATGSADWVNILPIGSITANGGVFNQTAVSGTLTHLAPTNLTVSKATNPSTLTFPGEVSRLTITIDNGSQAVSGLSITDHFTNGGTAGGILNGMVIASTPAANTTCPGGIVNAIAGGTSIGLSGVSLTANQSCTVTVNVSSNAVGGVTNTIPPGAIHTDQGLSNSGQATTSLTTQANLGVSKQFTPNVIQPNQRSRLRITLFNPASQPAAELSLSDNLPAGVTIPTGPNAMSTCSGGTVSTPTSSRVVLSGGNLAAQSGGVAASCYIEIDVTAALTGDYINTIPTAAVTAIIGGGSATNSQPASDVLRVKTPLSVHKAIANKTLDAGNPVGFTTGDASRAPGAAAPLIIRLDNANGTALTGTAFTDNLPTNLVVAQTPNATTTCVGGTVFASPSGSSVRLSGGTIPATGQCTVSVDVLSNISGSYTNTLASGAVTTHEGVTNGEPTQARLLVSTPPTVAKQFSPAVILPAGISTLTIVLGNDNGGAATLTSPLVDTLPTAPGPVVVASTPNVGGTCTTGSVTANAGSGTITYASGASIPAGGCRISVDVTAVTAGEYINNIPAGALNTNLGVNQQPANASLKVSTQGYVTGRVFADNNVSPNGTYDPGTDTPLSGVSIELHSGLNCSGALITQIGLTNPESTDVLGNYAFTGLAAGTYSVCQPGQPPGTLNSTTTAGGITPANGSTGTAGIASNPTAGSSQILAVVLNGDGAGGEVSGTTGNNFAEIIPSALSGTVFKDANNNGIQNGADTGIGGVTLTLSGTDFKGATINKTTSTDANGHYSYTALLPGTYTLTEPSQPTGTSNGITTAGIVGHGGASGAVTGTGSLPSAINTIGLPPNTTSSGNNFAEITNGRILRGKVFVDYNNDGVLNGPDHGLSGQILQLSGSDINSNPVTGNSTTGSDGSYIFTLPSGTYSVDQPSQPPGTSNGITTAGTSGGTASNPTPSSSRIANVNLTSGDSVANNFAEPPAAAPDLVITKTHSPASLGAGSSTGYFTFTPGNIGSVDSSGTITIDDPFPPGLTPTAASGTAWTCSISGQTVHCTSASIISAAGTGNPVMVAIRVGTGLAGQLLVNTATISGGNEPPGLSGNNTGSDTVTIATSAQVSGHVWLDKNHDRVRDSNETVKPGWDAELLLGGQVVATAITDASGAYTLANISPGGGYSLRFRQPSTGLIWGSAVTNESGTATIGSRDTGPNTVNHGTNTGGDPAGATLAANGSLTGMTLLAGDNIVEQSLPLDPAGVVYDAVTRNPVAGASITINGPAGFNPAIHLVGGTATVTTGTDGIYQFLLTPTAPSGAYTLSVTTYPGGYLPRPSTLIPVCGNTLTVSNAPNPALVQTSANPPAVAASLHNPNTCPASSAGFTPAGQASTQYYASFNITVGTSANVVNNHIPLDPILGGAIRINKTTPKRDVKRGELVPYTITATNTLSTTLTSIAVRDQMPAGFKLVPGSASINGVKMQPTQAGRLLIWNGLTFAPQEVKTIQLILVIGSGVGEGKYVNQAWAENTTANTRVSNVGIATVRVVPDPLFDCSDLIGKVFDDKNINGYPDQGEPGLPGVRVVTVRGLLITTDAYGRFHLACADVPNELNGSNFIMKLDERSLPSGYRLTTENPRVVRLTRGKLAKLNFGAALHRVVRVDIDRSAFSTDGHTLAQASKQQLNTLIETLKQHPSRLRVSYTRIHDENISEAQRRLETFSTAVKHAWQQCDCGHYALTIEQEQVSVGGAPTRRLQKGGAE